MKSTFTVVVGILCSFFLRDSFAQESVIAEPGLFRNAAQPVKGAVPFPENSGFVTINPSVFAAANMHNPEIFTIENFPLGQESVTLHVEQFDVLRNDSKLVLGTKDGDIPTSTPSHVLLHGTVDGNTNSHVYIAVFDGYAMGYIDASPDERYLIQPVSLNMEGESTMIIYKQSDVARPIPEGEKWQCGTEEFTPNFPAIGKLSETMGKPVAHVPEAQAQKTVHFLSIAVDCDNTYYLANGSDKTKAQNYAIAVLGAHSDIYIRDLNCGVMAGYLRVWTTKDTYSDNGDSNQYILPVFTDYWNNNMDNITYAAALLYTNHHNGGLAYLATMCNVDQTGHQYAVCGLNTGYTFPHDGYIWDVDVSAHEFGHVCGSLHTFNCFWNPPIDSCYPSEGGCFNQTVTRKGTIMSYCHLTSAGTELKFHPRVASFLKDRFSSASVMPCAASVSLPGANAGPNQASCGSGVSIGANATGGTAPLTYSWRPATGLSSTTDPVVTASPTKTTTYIVTVTDANMLRSYDTVVVTVDKPVVTTGGNLTICGSGTYTLSGSATGIGPFSYQWVDTTTDQVVGTNAQVDVPLVGTKTYRLEVIDSVGCTSSALKTLTVFPAPTVPVITNVADSLFSTPATTYKWYLGTSFVSGGTKQKFVPTKSGSYSVRTTNENGCDTISKPFAFTIHAGGVEEELLKSGIHLYPNPASNALTFDYSSIGDVPLELSITDLLGNTLYHVSRRAGENSPLLSIDISSYVRGTYFIRYSCGGITSMLKFVKE